MKQKSKYHFSTVKMTLTANAIEWLSGTTTDSDCNEIRNIIIFTELLKEMRTASGCDSSFRRPLNLQPGQAQFSEIGLAERWKLGRKKMHNILSKMQTLGLVKVYYSRVGSTLEFPCLTAWRALEESTENYKNSTRNQNSDVPSTAI